MSTIPPIVTYAAPEDVTLNVYPVVGPQVEPEATPLDNFAILASRPHPQDLKDALASRPTLDPSVPIPHDEFVAEKALIVAHSDASYQHRYNLWYIVLATANACLGFLFFSYNIVIWNALLIYSQNYLFRENAGFLNVFIAACPNLTAIISSLITGSLAIKFGKRKIMMFADVIGIIGVIMCLFQILGVVIAGRLIIGLSVGFTAVAAPLYFNELAPVEYRGQFANGPNIFSAMGILFAALLGTILPSVILTTDNDQTWRVLIAIAILPALIRFLVLLFFFRRETPYYYLDKNKHEKLRQSLRNIYNGDIIERIQELQAEKEYIQNGKKKRLGLIKVFKLRFFAALFVCILIESLQYLSGLNLILVYSGEIYRDGISNDPNNVTPSVLGTVTPFLNFFTAIVAIYTASQFNRKPLLVIGTFCTGLIGVIYGVLAITISPSSLIAKMWLVFWPIPWGLSLGSVLYVVVPETLPDAGVSVATTFNWIFAYLTMQFYPRMRDSLTRGGSFILLGGITIIGSLLLALFLDETKGKNKDEILEGYLHEKIADKVNQRQEINAERQGQKYTFNVADIAIKAEIADKIQEAKKEADIDKLKSRVGELAASGSVGRMKSRKSAQDEGVTQRQLEVEQRL